MTLAPGMCVKRVAIFASRSFLPGMIRPSDFFRCGKWTQSSTRPSGDSPSRRSTGAGLFHEGADAVLRFVFDVVGVTRLEARAVVETTRGNAALRKIGAVKEAS